MTTKEIRVWFQCPPVLQHLSVLPLCHQGSHCLVPETGIMEADHRQVTTVFTVQPSFHHRHLTNQVSWSVTIFGERAVTPHLVVHRRWWRFMVLGLSSADGEWWLDCENCCYLTVVGLHDTGPWSFMFIDLLFVCTWIKYIRKPLVSTDLLYMCVHWMC